MLRAVDFEAKLTRSYLGEPMGYKRTKLASKLAYNLALVLLIGATVALAQGQSRANAVAQAAGSGGVAGATTSAQAGVLTAAAASSAQASPLGAKRDQYRQIERKRKQQQLRQTVASLYKQLMELELRESNSLNECIQWDKLNLALIKLLGDQRQERPSEQVKRQQCNQLHQLVGEARAKMGAFMQLVGGEAGHLDYVDSLLGHYLDLKSTAQVNAALSIEFEHVKAKSEQVRDRVDALERFISSMRAKLVAPCTSQLETSNQQRSSGESNGQQPQQQQPGNVRASAEASASAGHEPEAQAADELAIPMEEIKALDATLRNLVDQEEELDERQLAELADLGHMLERILAAGEVDLNSGRFRYLSGTLDAVRAVLLHRLESDNLAGEPEPVGAESSEPLGQVAESAASAELVDELDEVAPVGEPQASAHAEASYANELDDDYEEDEYEEDEEEDVASGQANGVQQPSQQQPVEQQQQQQQPQQQPQQPPQPPQTSQQPQQQPQQQPPQPQQQQQQPPQPQQQPSAAASAFSHAQAGHELGAAGWPQAVGSGPLKNFVAPSSMPDWAAELSQKVASLFPQQPFAVGPTPAAPLNRRREHQ